MTDAQDQPGRDASTKTVMVVDSDIIARMTIADYLRGCGYRVIEGVSGNDVRAVLAAGYDIEVLLIDMQLQSSEDGFALARAIRSKHPDIAVIRTSSTARLAEKAGELCDDGPMTKPYHPQELLRRIQSLRRSNNSD